MSTVTPAQKLSDAIRSARRERVALVAFMTAGFPSKERFRADLEEVASEADVVEIGVPFTDPLADGVTIQRSSLAALAQGVTLRWILDTLDAMPRVNAQLVLMGYLNPMLAFGLPELAARAAKAGVAGFIRQNQDAHGETLGITQPALIGRHRRQLAGRRFVALTDAPADALYPAAE